MFGIELVGVSRRTKDYKHSDLRPEGVPLQTSGCSAPNIGQICTLTLGPDDLWRWRWWVPHRIRVIFAGLFMGRRWFSVVLHQIHNPSLFPPLSIHFGWPYKRLSLDSTHQSSSTSESKCDSTNLKVSETIWVKRCEFFWTLNLCTFFNLSVWASITLP